MITYSYLEHSIHRKRDNNLCTKLALCLLKNKIFLIRNSDQDAASVRSYSRDICDIKSHIEPKYMKNIVELGKYRKLRL